MGVPCAGTSVVAVEAAGETLRPFATIDHYRKQKPGSDDWQLTRVRLDQRGRVPGSRRGGLLLATIPVRRGNPGHLYVSTKRESEVTIEIFRTGYYGGKGARLMTTLGPLPVPVTARSRS